MSDTKVTTPKPAVIDAKGNELERGMIVIFDETAEGKSEGPIHGLEHQRQRVVIRTGEGPKDFAVRPALKVRVLKNKSGKIQRVEKAVKAAGAKAKATASAS